MSQLNEVNIDEKETIYDVKMSYHSDLKCQNYDLRITAIEETDGRVSLYPKIERDESLGTTCWEYVRDHFYGRDDDSFTFIHSDPDRVIAIAQMMMAFAQSIKNEHKALENVIDISNNA